MNPILRISFESGFVLFWRITGAKRFKVSPNRKAHILICALDRGFVWQESACKFYLSQEA